MSDNPGGTICFTREKLTRFSRAYRKATADKAKTFEFDGCKFVVGYAKYLIEYLEGRFKAQA